MLTSFLATGNNTWSLVFIHRDVHVAVLGDELAREYASRLVLLQEEYLIESWEVGLDVVGEASVLGFHVKARLVHHAQVSPNFTDNDFIAPRLGLQRSFDVAFHLPQPRHCDEGEQDGNDVFLVHIRLCLYPLLYIRCNRGNMTLRDVKLS